MRIEDYWNDGMLYYVEVVTAEGFRLVRDVVVPVEMTNEEVREVVKKSFPKSKEILSMECFSEVLCMKSLGPTLQSQDVPTSSSSYYGSSKNEALSKGSAIKSLNN